MKRTFFLLILFVLFSLLSLAQELSVSGTVIDENNEPLPGVNVLEEGTTNGVTTDVNGRYNITSNFVENSKLVFSFIGYQNKEVLIAGRLNLDVQLLLKHGKVIVSFFY